MLHWSIDYEDNNNHNDVNVHIIQWPTVAVYFAFQPKETPVEYSTYTQSKFINSRMITIQLLMVLSIIYLYIYQSLTCLILVKAKFFKLTFTSYKSY